MDLGGHLESWRPEPATTVDDLLPGPVMALSAVLDQPIPVGPLPPLWHWLYFLDWAPQHDLGEDGHLREGHFLPPIPNRRRMIAGGRLEVHRPLELGRKAERVSTLGEVAVKQGSTGDMVFVTVRHEISQYSRLCLVEEQDVVYRSGEDERRKAIFSVDTAEAPASGAPWQLSLRPDSRLLFRFSALTANAHRIHYDAPYVREVEGYPGLVVHGPLLVLLMLELVRDQKLRSLSFRLRRPVFAGEHVSALGGPDDSGAGLRIATAREDAHAVAEVRFA
jgi:hydroxyacyl-ACP dehydratase HTD2-like protein with hotdog domain